MSDSLWPKGLQHTRLLCPWDTPDNAEVGCHALLQRIFLTRVSCSSCIVQFSSVAQSCLTPCNPMDCSTPGFPVHHQFLELAQTHVHRVSDAIQPSHPLSSHFPPAFNLSQRWSLFQWVGSSYQVAKVLELQLQHQCFQWISGLISFRIDWFDLLAVRGTLKSLLQYYNSKASIPLAFRLLYGPALTSTHYY